MYSFIVVERIPSVLVTKIESANNISQIDRRFALQYDMTSTNDAPIVIERTAISYDESLPSNTGMDNVVNRECLFGIKIAKTVKR